MRKGILGFSLSLLLVPNLAPAYPVSLDIASFAIDNYTGNGSGMADLSFMVASSQNFFWAALDQVPDYAVANTNNPNLAQDARNTQVTKAAITFTGTGIGQREYSDVVFYGGHGLNGKLYLGNAPAYQFVNPSDMPMGSGYNRWFFTNSCSLFNGGDPATVWKPTFKGLKAMLGFKSFVFDNNQSWQLYDDFWVNWTFREKSLLTSFFDAQANYGYKHLYPGKGLEPGCLSAEVPSDRIDYCRETFKFVAHDYNKATPNTGYYYSKVIGTPQY